MTDMNHTKEIWEETIAEFPKMWLQDEYVGFQGKHWSLPPRKILPKPYGKSPPRDVVRRRVAAVVLHGRAQGARRAGLQRAEGLRHGVGAGEVQDGDRRRRADR